MSLKFIKLLSVGLLLTSSMSFAASGSNVLEEAAKDAHKKGATGSKVTVVSLEPVSQNSPAPSVHPAASSSDLSSQTLSSVEAEGANANAKPPSELELLVEAMKKEVEKTYFPQRAGNVKSYTLPHSLTLTTLSAVLDSEFNELEILVADRFYEYGKDHATASGSTSSTPTANYHSKDRAKEIMSWLSTKIQKMTDEKKTLDAKMVERKDGVLGALKAPSEILSSTIDSYKLLLKEVLFHADRTDSFMRYTRKAIADLDKSCDALVKLAAEEKNESCRKKHEETIASQKANIQKFKNQILSAEALMHAIYPYHRRSLVQRIFGSQNYRDRGPTTGSAQLPNTFKITHEMLEDNVGDKDNHYQNYLKLMLNDDAFKLKAAKEAKRIVFESAPTTPAATVAVVATPAVTVTTTAGETLERKEEGKKEPKKK